MDIGRNEDHEMSFTVAEILGVETPSSRGNYGYSYHLLQRLKERGITIEEVRGALIDPDKVITAYGSGSQRRVVANGMEIVVDDTARMILTVYKR